MTRPPIYGWKCARCTGLTFTKTKDQPPTACESPTEYRDETGRVIACGHPILIEQPLQPPKERP